MLDAAKWLRSFAAGYRKQRDYSRSPPAKAIVAVLGAPTIFGPPGHANRLEGIG
jgi:hypothetical protein